jgi:hypothetical protein
MEPQDEREVLDAGGTRPQGTSRDSVIRFWNLPVSLPYFDSCLSICVEVQSTGRALGK